MPLQLSLEPFGLIVILWCKVDLKERETTNEINELEQKEGGEGAAELFPWESHATASLIFQTLPTTALLLNSIKNPDRQLCRCTSRILKLLWKTMWPAAGDTEMSEKISFDSVTFFHWGWRLCLHFWRQQLHQEYQHHAVCFWLMSSTLWRCQSAASFYRNTRNLWTIIQSW